MDFTEEELAKEEWRVIPKYPQYMASTLGRIKHLNGVARILQENHNGYKTVFICNGTDQCSRLVHRLVAMTFLEDFRDDLPINHKNHIKEDNRVCNLEICTDKENTDYSHGVFQSRAIIKMTCNGDTICKYNNIVEAISEFDNKASSCCCILATCQGQMKTAYGYKWAFEGENVEPCTKPSTITQFDIHGKQLCQYKNSNEASSSTNISEQSILDSCEGKTKIVGGYLWKYTDEMWSDEYYNLRMVYQYDLSGKLIAQYSSVYIASKATHTSKDHIYQNCRGLNQSVNGYIWSYEKKEIKPYKLNRRRHAVLQYDENGKLLAEYESTVEAGKALGISDDGLRQQLLRGSGHYAGYIWKYKDSSTLIKQRQNRTIYQYTKDNKLVASHPTIAEASRTTNVRATTISKCCRGDCKTAGGYVWRYA